MIAGRHLTKQFGERRAVDDVSFQVPSGTICAVLGPNGAGKSTMVKMLTGLLRPSSGDAFVAGHSVWEASPSMKQMLGVVPENLGLFDDLTVEEHLRLSGEVYRLKRTETLERTAQLLRALDLAEGRHTFLNQCSHGMRKKTALAMALIHNPRVVVLDEPFEGIDPTSTGAIQMLLTSMAQRGVTVLITSHNLPVVTRMAGHIVIMRSGRIVWDSTAAELPEPLEHLYTQLAGTNSNEEIPWLGSALS